MLRSAAYTARHKQALGAAFTSLKVVVPHTKAHPKARSVELGYRPIPYSTADLQQMFQTIRTAVEAKTKVDYSECKWCLAFSLRCMYVVAEVQFVVGCIVQTIGSAHS